MTDLEEMFINNLTCKGVRAFKQINTSK